MFNENNFVFFVVKWSTVFGTKFSPMSEASTFSIIVLINASNENTSQPDQEVLCKTFSTDVFQSPFYSVDANQWNFITRNYFNYVAILRKTNNAYYSLQWAWIDRITGCRIVSGLNHSCYFALCSLEFRILATTLELIFWLQITEWEKLCASELRLVCLSSNPSRSPLAVERSYWQ